MAKPAINAPSILRFPSTAVDDDDEVQVGLPPSRTAKSLGVGDVTGVDLGEIPRVWLFIGTGNRGKTTMARWLADQLVNRGAEAIAGAAGIG